MKVGERVTLKDGTICQVVDRFQAKQTRGWWVDDLPDEFNDVVPRDRRTMWDVAGIDEDPDYNILCPVDELDTPAATTLGLPTGDKDRKALPIFRGPLMYFPNALLAVAAVCKAGNDQHNPGQPLHWAREKSTEQMDTALRHMMDHGMGNTRDTDGTYHLAKAAWRILAELQLTIEKDAK